MRHVKLQAHRGVSSEYPENTFAAFKAAIEEGYDIIELDPKFTADNRCVILHDRTMNRTARDENGNPPTIEKWPIAEITLEEARKWDVGLWKDEKFRGERIPTLEEVIEFIAAHDVPFKFDNVWETFTEEQQDIFLSKLKAASLGSKIGFTCHKMPTFKKAADMFPEAVLHWDGKHDEETLAEVMEIAKGHHLTVWICFENSLTGWFKDGYATPEVCQRVKKDAEIGIWILHKEDELPAAVNDFLADVIETTGHIKPAMLKKFED